ncbi:MAG: hypothetical protein R6V05_00655 [Candidatus Brocadiia bacterium]
MRHIMALPFTILALLGSIALLLVYVWSVVWSYGDAEARGKPGCLVALLVALLSWPLGLILWVVFRPERRLRGR